MDEVEIKEIIKKFKGCQKILSAAGDDVRQYIIIQMLESDSTISCGGMRVGEIAARTHLSRPAISHHLKVLKEAGIIKMRKEGTKNFYYFDVDLVELDKLIQLMCHTKLIMQKLPDRSKKAY